MVCIFFLAVIGLIHIRLYHYPLSGGKSKEQEIIQQLNFIGEGLKERNTGYSMQSIFPEGYVFIHALYGLAWCELAKSPNIDSSIRNKALLEARWAYQCLKDEFAKSNFDKDLSPRYGIFYCGWKNYLLANILEIQNSKRVSLTEKKEFENACEEIIKAIQQSSTPFIESYEGSSWPADAFVAMASVKKYDRLFHPKYDSTIKAWIIKVKGRLDKSTGLVPHSTNFQTGETLEGARGSSSVLILRFLAEIDPSFALEQFKVFKDKFLLKRLGLPAIREYTENTHEFGDIDSGPVIWDVGFSATIVSIAAFQKFGEEEFSQSVQNTIEGFGFPFSSGSQKRYIFGKLPIADAFLAWGKVTKTDKELIRLTNTQIHVNSWWRTPFQLISAGFILILSLPVYIRCKKRKKTHN